MVLVYNQLWDTPYRKVLKKISKDQGVPIVDSKALIDRVRTTIERDLEERLDLQPFHTSSAEESENVKVFFRVYVGNRPVPKGIFITGAHQKLGDLVPNQVVMYDDGTHGDQRAGDAVWSYAATFEPGTRLFYVYTNSGKPGQWEGLDIPDIRRFTVAATDQKNRIYRPIETFGKMYMQADGWHTNAYGYELIAEELFKILRKHEKVQAFLHSTRTDRLGRNQIVH